MISTSEKNELIAQFQENSKSMFEEVEKNLNLTDAMEQSNVDDIRYFVKNIQNVVIANIPTGIGIPKVSMYVSPTGGDAVTLVNITITNKVTSNKKFSYSTTVTKDRAIEKVFDFMNSVYSALILDELVEANLSKVNDVLAQATAESGVDYGIKIVSSLGNEGKKIASMTDDQIVFVADEDRVFSLDNIIVLLDKPTDLISEEVIQSHYNSIVEEIATAQTPAQLVGIHGGVLVAHICDISKRMKPMTLIKKVCSKNITKIHGEKDTIAYYSENNVYSLIARRDGKFEVILAPFDTNTLRKVDVDVLKEIA